MVLIAGCALLTAVADPLAAGQLPAALALREGSLPPPADTGKPALTLPPPGVVEAAPGECPPVLPCGTRLLGAVRRGGAVVLTVPAWRW